MKISEETKFEFECRRYRLGLKLWKHEIENDFPVLKCVDPYFGCRILILMASLEQEEKGLLANALIKRCFSRAVIDDCGDVFNEKERLLARNYPQLAHQASWSKEAEQYLPTKEKKVNRGKLKKAVIEKVGPVLGGTFEKCFGVEWRNRTTIGPWQVLTYWDFGGRVHQLAFHHVIQVEDHVELAGQISILSMLGLGGQIDWFNIDDSDIEKTAESAKKLCSYFMEAATKLLDGLAADAE